MVPNTETQDTVISHDLTTSMSFPKRFTAVTSAGKVRNDMIGKLTDF